VKHLHFLDTTRIVGSLTVCAFALLVSIFLHLKLEVPTVEFLNLHFGGHRRSTEFKGTPS
jgi:hypothetical protein